MKRNSVDDTALRITNGGRAHFCFHYHENWGCSILRSTGLNQTLNFGKTAFHSSPTTLCNFFSSLFLWLILFPLCRLLSFLLVIVLCQQFLSALHLLLSLQSSAGDSFNLCHLLSFNICWRFSLPTMRLIGCFLSCQRSLNFFRSSFDTGKLRKSLIPQIITMFVIVLSVGIRDSTPLSLCLIHRLDLFYLFQFNFIYFWIYSMCIFVSFSLWASLLFLSPWFFELFFLPVFSFDYSHSSSLCPFHYFPFFLSVTHSFSLSMLLCLCVPISSDFFWFPPPSSLYVSLSPYFLSILISPSPLYSYIFLSFSLYIIIFFSLHLNLSNSISP